MLRNCRHTKQIPADIAKISAIAVPMTKAAEAGVLPAHLENGGDTSATSDCRMVRGVGQSGRKNGGCGRGKRVRETASACRSVRLVAERCFADLDAGQDRCVTPGGATRRPCTRMARLVPEAPRSSEDVAPRAEGVATRLLRSPPGPARAGHRACRPTRRLRPAA
jgi:hypothetical protein